MSYDERKKTNYRILSIWDLTEIQAYNHLNFSLNHFRVDELLLEVFNCLGFIGPRQGLVKSVLAEPLVVPVVMYLWSVKNISSDKIT